MCVVPFLVLAYLENGRVERTLPTSILLETGKNAKETFKILIVAFGKCGFPRSKVV
jgi:hypothetical protein